MSSRQTFSSGVMEGHMGPNWLSTEDVPTFVLPEVLCGEVQCCDTKSTCLAKYLVSISKCAAVNIPELEGRMLG
jgi:hypothetical protein